MGVWWERMLAGNAGIVGAAEPSRAVSWWTLAEAEWSDYQRGFRIRGSERDPLNALHRLAFQQMFLPAWQATPNPIVCRFTSRAMLRYARATWRRASAFRPSRTLAILEQTVLRPEPNRPAVLLIDPGCSRRARLIFPQRLEANNRMVRVRDLNGKSSSHVLELDPDAETWAYSDGNGTNWRGGEDRGRLVLLPPQLMNRDPLPFVEPVVEAEDDAPISLTILSGSALFPVAPDEAPWWLLADGHSVLPQGYVHAGGAGRSISQVMQVSGAYEYCVLEAGRGLVWRGEGTGWDVVRFVPHRDGVQFSIQTDGGQRWGSLELVQVQPQRGCVRMFRVDRLELPAGSRLEISFTDDTGQLAVANRSAHPIGISVGLEIGWTARAQRRRLPRMTLGPAERVTIQPGRWQALGLGPITSVYDRPGAKPIL